MTVAELIAELRKYPPDMEITSTAADCGGYDCTYVNEIIVMPFELYHVPNDSNLKRRDPNDPDDAKWIKKYMEHYTPQMGRLYVGGKDEQI